MVGVARCSEEGDVAYILGRRHAGRYTVYGLRMTKYGYIGVRN